MVAIIGNGQKYLSCNHHSRALRANIVQIRQSGLNIMTWRNQSYSLSMLLGVSSRPSRVKTFRFGISHIRTERPDRPTDLHQYHCVQSYIISMVERFHRQLETAIRCLNRTEALPAVLRGVCTAHKKPYLHSLYYASQSQ